MFRKELLILGSLAIAVFLAVAAVTSMVGQSIQGTAALIAEDTLPGLVNAGAAISRMRANWLSVHLVAHARSPAERATLVSAIQTNSNEHLWKAYGDYAVDPVDKRDFAALLTLRADYLKLREEYLASAASAAFDGSPHFLESKLTPAYEKYAVAAERVFDYNNKIGTARAQDVIRHARIAPLLFGAFGIAVFGFGIFVGLRCAFTGLHLGTRLRDS